MKKLKSMSITDRQPLCDDVVISFIAEGYVDINDSDSFTLSVDRATQIIDWLIEWRRREIGNETD